MGNIITQNSFKHGHYVKLKCDQSLYIYVNMIMVFVLHYIIAALSHSTVLFHNATPKSRFITILGAVHELF